MDNAQLISALQSVISPVVFISGVGMLVLSMTNRFSHATTRIRQLAGERKKLAGAERERTETEIRILYRRLRILLIAISLALGSILLAVLLMVTLFANYMFDATFRGTIIAIFALSLLSLVASLILFIRDMGLALTALREDLHDML